MDDRFSIFIARTEADSWGLIAS